MYKKVTSILDKIMIIFVIISAVLLLAVMFGVSVDAIMRYFFNQSIAWMLEVSEYSLAWITFLTAAWVLKKNKHVTMDFMVNKLKPKPLLIFSVVTSGIGTLSFIVITWFGAKVVLQLFQSADFFATTLRTPTYIPFMIIPIGSFVFFLQYLRNTNDLVTKFRSTYKKVDALAYKN